MSETTRASTYRALAAEVLPARSRPLTIAQVADRTDLPAAQVRRDLLVLRHQGMVQERAAGWVAVAPAPQTGRLRTYDELAQP